MQAHLQPMYFSIRIKVHASLQAGASNPAEPAVPAAPAEPAVPAAPHSSTSLQWFSSGHLADV